MFQAAGVKPSGIESRPPLKSAGHGEWERRAIGGIKSTCAGDFNGRGCAERKEVSRIKMSR